MAAGTVNSLVIAFAITIAACHPPRRIPSVPPGTWSTLLGDPGRSTYAAEAVPSEVRVVWRQSVGRGIAAPVQVHGNVVLATTTGRTAVTLRAEDGMQYWSYGFRSAIAGSALKKDERVIVATGDRDRRVHAIEITRGRRVWSRPVGAVRVEPLLAGDRIVIATEAGDAVALSVADGTEAWRVRIGAPPAAPPIAWNASVIMTTLRDSLFRLDLSSGRMLERGVLPAPVSAPALVHEGALIFPLRSGEIVSLALPSLETVWRTSIDGLTVAAPVASRRGIAVLTRDAVLWLIDPAGRAQRLAVLGGAATGSLAVAANGFIVGMLDGTLALIDFDGRTVWREPLGESIVAPVAIRDGSVYVPLLGGDIVKLR
ncbi:MAG: PQQ-like beta-propeller repeat protein [Gemmatimonadetes bacterium]|nr:PQQ-like beta-propeller repeat protein [Gemmatimonadota bacterium]